MKKLQLLAASAILLASGTAAMANHHGDDHVKLSAASQKFVKMATIGNMFEIESSELADTKSNNDAVEDFAEKMIADHTKATKDLKATLDQAGIDDDILPTELDAKHQSIIDKLDRANENSFDAQYIAAQKQAHVDAVALFETYSKTGDNPDLKAFATNTLPVLKEHKMHVSKLTPAKK